jgi:hypothetical protein
MCESYESFLIMIMDMNDTYSDIQNLIFETLKTKH